MSASTTPAGSTRPRVSRAHSIPSPTPPTFAQTVRLVAAREILARIRSKAFLVSTAILLLAAVGSVIVGGIVSANPSSPKVAVVGNAIQIVEQTKAFTVLRVDDVDAAEQLVRDGEVDAAVVPAPTTDTPLGVTVIALDAPPSDVMRALSVSPAVTLLEPSEQNPFLIYLVALGFGLVFFMSAITFGTTIAQSVVEEKQTRVVEILMSAISVRALLAGKVAGNTVMAFGQIVAIGVLVALGMAVTNQNTLLADVGVSIVWFVVFFVFGFILLASLYAATASMVSRQEDVGSATAPVMILVMLPYILVIIFNDNPAVLAIMSYIPFSAPVGMPMRLFLGTAEWWEPLASLAILIATTAVIILFGSRIYANSLLRMGARVPFREALRG